ncbi:Hypothetical predicted protein [Paramuricea clavata]|uniref:Uncharacterized protein n=1 Tax=Paramuricea clavata TaxID=317549 RepID=A0A6S7HIK3_PARCT|nr:Hypothetical predicted protein [Paramuricea clavata]
MDGDEEIDTLVDPSKPYFSEDPGYLFFNLSNVHQAFQEGHNCIMRFEGAARDDEGGKIPSGRFTEEARASMDEKRIASSKRKASLVEKRKRIAQRQAKLVRELETRDDEGGPFYSSDAFSEGRCRD